MPIKHELTRSLMVQAASADMTVGMLIEAAEALRAANQPDQICGLYKTWIAHHGDHPTLHAIYFNYAVALADAQDRTGAVNALRHAILMKPDFFQPHINLGNQLEALGRPEAAVAAWMALVNALPSVTPDAVTFKIAALKQVGRVLEAGHVPASADAALTECLAIHQDQPEVVQHLVSLRQGQCRWPPIADLGRIPRQRLLTAISPLSASCHTDDPIFQLANAYVYNRRSIGVPPHPRAVLDQPRPGLRSDGKLRIGYVSSDLRHHAVGFAMTDIIETHDHDRFEIFAYYCGIDTIDQTQLRIRNAADHWIDLNGLDDAQAACRIRGDGIDILVDLNGYTKDARTRVFALRPAPIAVNWFGFPNTMGSSYHHYIIADEHVIPPGHEHFFSERVIRLPCYQANDRKRVVAPEGITRAEAGLAEDAVVLCCLNGLQKLTERVFLRWLRILREVPASVLWLLSDNTETQARLREVAERQGVGGHRLVFAGKRANPEHLARFRLADLFLDTFPYGAHTTASDALWMGVPVLTLPGRSFASRVGASLVRAAGLPELVCTSPEHYVRMAIELAANRPLLAALKNRLVAGREACLLFDTPALVRHLEAAYRQMHEAGLRGDIPVPDLRNLDLYHEIGVTLDLEAIETLDDGAYRALYRERLADIDYVFPVAGDTRLWRT